MTQVYTYEIVGQLFGTNLIQSGSIEDVNQHRTHLACLEHVLGAHEPGQSETTSTMNSHNTSAMSFAIRFTTAFPTL